jgi:hypothetical protein
MQRRSFIQALLGVLSAPFVASESHAKPTRAVIEYQMLDHRAVMARPLYASQGEWVTCENGHKIVQFARDVKHGEMFDPAALVNWQQYQPEIGQIVCACSECQARFFLDMRFHFDDGWHV